jgi:hypothetical protein
MFPAMKTDNVAPQLSVNRMAKKGFRQGKIQTLMGFEQNGGFSFENLFEISSFVPSLAN